MFIGLLQLAFICLFLSVPSALADVNSSVISSWDRPRAALVRHDIYLEGGVLKTARIVGGEWLVESATEYKEASLFKLSLNKSFDVHSEKPAVFEAIDYDVPPSPWADGFMFADYDEFYVYGGMSKDNALSNYRITSNILYDPPPSRQGDASYLLPTDRRESNPASFAYRISNAAGANVPSEKLGYYFGGTRDESDIPLQNIVATTKKPGIIQSNTLLVVNTSSQGNAFWNPVGLPIDPGAPTQVRTRSEGGLVWIPAGDQGMLVAIGGAINYTSQYSNSYKRANPEEGNNFTQEITIYDIANNRWYTQNVQDDAGYPPRLVQFCAVAVTNSDGRNTHHDIYVVGGWDGEDPNSITANVSVLSIPSFRWTTRVPVTGTSAPRQGHSCFSPYPDQIIVIGGTEKGKTNFDGPYAVDVLNINKLEWTGAYDPTKYSNYTPHSNVLNQVTSWPDDMDPELRANLERPYDPLNEGKIKQYWPYTLVPDIVPTPTPTGSPPDDDSDSYVIPVAATLSSVGGLALIGALLFFCLRRRRRLQRESHRQSTTTHDTTTSHSHNWIDRWLGGTTVAGASSTSHPGNKDLASDNITETDGTTSPLPPAMSETTNVNSPSELDTSYFHGRPPLYGGKGPHEIDSTGVHEVHGRSSVGSSNLFFNDRDRDRDHADRGNDFRQYPLYPPSVVSGGHGYHPRSTAGGDELDSVSVSHPTEGHHSPSTPAANISPSSPSASVSAARSSPSPLAAPIASIPEQAAFRLDADGSGSGSGVPTPSAQGHGHGQDLVRAPSNRAVSPIQSDGGAVGARAQRPGHRRHNSSMSSGLSPLPSPGREGLDGFAGGDRDRDGEVEREERGMRTL